MARVYTDRRSAVVAGVRRSDTHLRGVVAAQVLVSLLLLLGFAALAVDSGVLYVSTAEMQLAVDAGALSGAGALREGADAAEEQATTFATKHAVSGEALTGWTGGVTATSGFWDGIAKDFFPLEGDETVLPNAMLVDGHRSAVQLYFAGLLGTHTSYVSRDAVAVLGSGRCVGIWGLDGLSGGGTITTDSYDSREGGYGGGNIYANGDICTGGDLDLSGSSLEIFGDAMYGPGSLVDISGHPSVWGIVAPMCCSVDAPDVDISDAMLTNDNNLITVTDGGRDPFSGGPEDLRLTGTDNLTLAPGTYYFTSVSMAGHATLTVTGETEIWISGSAQFTGGGLINTSEDPGDLTIYSTGPDLHIAGGADFYGVILAPEVEVTLSGNSGFYGLLVGETVILSGTTDIHIDEAMVDAVFGVSSVSTVLVE